MGDQDHANKILFGQSRFVEDLLRFFLPAERVERLDFDSLERVPASFVGKDTAGKTHDRANDLVWKIRVRDGGSLFVYLMLEFQSTIDRRMALRVLTYTALLLQELVRGKHLAPGGKLPTVLPFVIYNGSPRWTAAEDVVDLFAPVPGMDSFLDPFRPRLRYFLIDEGRLRESDLDRPGNLTAVVLKIERSEDPEEIYRGVRKLTDELRGEVEPQILESVADWLRGVLASKNLPTLPVQYLENPEDYGTMLADTLERWHKEATQQGLAAGLEQGREQGREEGLEKGLRQGQRRGRKLGKQQGEAAILLKLLGLKFGALEPATRSRVRHAEPKELERWAQRILTAESLDEVLQPPKDPATRPR